MTVITCMIVATAAIIIALAAAAGTSRFQGAMKFVCGCLWAIAVCVGCYASITYIRTDPMYVWSWATAGYILTLLFAPFGMDVKQKSFKGRR
jgi:hypothetical protein